MAHLIPARLCSSNSECTMYMYIYIYVVLTAVCMSSFISTDMVDSRLGRDLGSRMKKVRARSMA